LIIIIYGNNKEAFDLLTIISGITLCVTDQNDLKIIKGETVFLISVFMALTPY